VTITAAAVPAASAFLDTVATTAKACGPSRKPATTNRDRDR